MQFARMRPDLIKDGLSIPAIDLATEREVSIQIPARKPCEGTNQYAEYNTLVKVDSDRVVAVMSIDLEFYSTGQNDKTMTDDYGCHYLIVPNKPTNSGVQKMSVSKQILGEQLVNELGAQWERHQRAENFFIDSDSGEPRVNGDALEYLDECTPLLVNKFRMAEFALDELESQGYISSVWDDIECENLEGTVSGLNEMGMLKLPDENDCPFEPNTDEANEWLVRLKKSSQK